MRRWNAIQVLVLAIVIASIPTIHNHSLVPGGDQPSLSPALTRPCAVCATTHARITVAAPSFSAPLETAEHFVLEPATEPVSPSARVLASRAPPAL